MILTHMEFTLTCGTLNLTCSMTVSSQTVENKNIHTLTCPIRLHVDFDKLYHCVSTVEDASVYSYEELIDEFCLLIIAGMDTTANTISLLLMTLIKHPQLHERYKCFLIG